MRKLGASKAVLPRFWEDTDIAKHNRDPGLSAESITHSYAILPASEVPNC